MDRLELTRTKKYNTGIIVLGNVCCIMEYIISFIDIKFYSRILEYFLSCSICN